MGRAEINLILGRGWTMEGFAPPLLHITPMQSAQSSGATPSAHSNDASASKLTTHRRRRPRRIARARLPLLTEEARQVLGDLSGRFQDFLGRLEPKRSPNTLRWYAHAFTVYRMYLEDGDTRTADAITARVQDLDGFTDWNLRRGVTAIAANAYWRALRPFFNDWEQREGAPNPYRTHKAPGFQAPDPKALAEDDCSRILLAAANYRRWDLFQRSRAAAVIGVMLYAGLRRSEALALVVGDVNFKTAEITVTHGKGQWGGKRRVVPIHPELARLLYAFVREREKRRLTDEAPEFFSSTRATGSMGTTTLSVVVRTLVRASGVQFSPHMLRHSFVTHLLRSGVPLHVARDLAGHSHIETTLLYAKVFSKDRHDNLRKLSFE